MSREQGDHDILPGKRRRICESLHIKGTACRLQADKTIDCENGRPKPIPRAIQFNSIIYSHNSVQLHSIRVSIVTKYIINNDNNKN